MFPKAKAIILAGSALAAFFLPGVSRGEGFTLTQTVSTSLLYESNSNLAPTGGKPESDYSLRVTPKIELTKESERMKLSGFYAPTGYVYFKHRNLDSFSHAAGADMGYSLSDKTSLDVGDLVGFSKDIREVSLSGIQVSRSDAVSNTASVGISHKFTPRTSMSLRLSDAMTNISGADRTTNGRTDSATVSGSFAATETTSVTTSYTFSKYFFNSPEEKGSTESHSALLGVAQVFPYSLELTLSGGAAYSPSLKNQYTAIYAAGIKKSFQRSSIALDYSRSLINTSLLSKLLNVDDRYSLAWSYTVAEAIDAGVSGFYATNKTRPVAEVDLTSWGYEAGGHWRPYSWMTLGVDYMHFVQTSKGTGAGAAGLDFKRDIVSISATFTAYEGRF